MSSQNHVAGGCACGAIKFVVTLPVLWCTHCHCHSCRRHHGAAIVTWFGVASANFRLSGREHLKWHVCSENAKRGFCGNCGSPFLFLTTRRPDEVHVARASLHDEVDTTPGSHIFFDQHVSWLPIEDSLPRFGGKGSVQIMEDLSPSPKDREEAP
jgi:hypothetical protein